MSSIELKRRRQAMMLTQCRWRRFSREFCPILQSKRKPPSEDDGLTTEIGECMLLHSRKDFIEKDPYG